MHVLIVWLMQTLTIDDVTDEKDDEFYMRRLDAGLFVLQLLDYIMIDISATGSSTVSLIYRLNKSAVARFARNIILVAQYRNLNRLKHNGF